MEVVQYIGGITSVLWGIGSVLWGVASVLWRLFSTVEITSVYAGGNISTVEGIQYCGRIPLALWGDNSSTCGGNFSAVGGTSVLWGITSV